MLGGGEKGQLFFIRIDAKKLEVKNKGMENIFLAVVLAGPRSKHVHHFCVWLYVFFPSPAACLVFMKVLALWV